MRTFLVLLAAALISSPSQAIQIKFYISDGTLAYRSKRNDRDLGKSVGTLTLESLKEGVRKNKIAFTGDENYVRSINLLGEMRVQIKTGEERAYGWCYLFNGETPEKALKKALVSTIEQESISQKLLVTSPHDQVVWYYGYSRKINQEWQDECLAEDPRMQKVLDRIKK